jgi:hypothetical protein
MIEYIDVKFSSCKNPVTNPVHFWLFSTFAACSGNHGYEHQGKPMDPNFAAEQRGIIPSAFGGIVRLTNFLSLRSKNLSLTNKYKGPG